MGFQEDCTKTLAPYCEGHCDNLAKFKRVQIFAQLTKCCFVPLFKRVKWEFVII